MPAREVIKDGDDEAEPLSDAVMGGEDPRGDGFGGEWLDCRGSRDASDLFIGALTYPLEDPGECEAPGCGGVGFLTGDFVAVEAGFLRFGFSRTPSPSISEAWTVGVVVFEAGCLERG